jgi:hypothetical protein
VTPSHASAVDPEASFAQGQAALQPGNLDAAEAAFRLGRPEEAQTELATSRNLIEASLNKQREKYGDAPVPNPS